MTTTGWFLLPIAAVLAFQVVSALAFWALIHWRYRRAIASKDLEVDDLREQLHAARAVGDAWRLRFQDSMEGNSGSPNSRREA